MNFEWFCQMNDNNEAPEALPKGSIPEPLADPLRALRRGIYWAILIAYVLFMLAVGLVFATKGRDSDLLLICVQAPILVLGTVWIFLLTLLLPKRSPDILYLRSFRTDPETGGIRTSLERALDNKFRVSGIREPKRRGWKILRFAAPVLFIFRYSNPRYLNLEAGNEWKGRLWRSLGEAKGVIIDIAELTPAVEAEIRLCEKCVGLKRILFVIRDDTSVDIWINRIQQVLGASIKVNDIQVVCWPATRRDRAQFEEKVRAFGQSLPAKPAGFKSSARSLAEQLPGELFRENSRVLGREIMIGLVVVPLILGMISFAAELIDPMLVAIDKVLTLTIGICYWVVTGVQWVSFIRNTGSWRKKLIAISLVVYMMIALTVAIAFLFSVTARIRSAADRMQSSNNLKQLGLALHNYHDTNNSLPTANAAEMTNEISEKYPVSWRVRILPFLDDSADSLFKQYRFAEPWDGPNNRKLIPLIPKVYQHPSASQRTTPIGHTHYRVFGSSKTAVGLTAVFIDGGRSSSLAGISDGLSSTLLIVEAEESVPWTMPEVLPFAPDQTLPKLGGFFKGGYIALLADGSTKFFMHSMPESKLRAYITPNGGESIGDDW
jgi:hypothetical protein